MNQSKQKETEESIMLPQCHTCRWFKDVGPGLAYRYTCNKPGTIIGWPIHNPYLRAKCHSAYDRV